MGHGLWSQRQDSIVQHTAMSLLHTWDMACEVKDKREQYSTLQCHEHTQHRTWPVKSKTRECSTAHCNVITAHMGHGLWSQRQERTVQHTAMSLLHTTWDTACREDHTTHCKTESRIQTTVASNGGIINQYTYKNQLDVKWWDNKSIYIQKPTWWQSQENKGVSAYEHRRIRPRRWRRTMQYNTIQCLQVISNHWSNVINVHSMRHGPHNQWKSHFLLRIYLGMLSVGSVLGLLSCAIQRWGVDPPLSLW